MISPFKGLLFTSESPIKNGTESPFYKTVKKENPRLLFQGSRGSWLRGRVPLGGQNDQADAEA